MGTNERRYTLSCRVDSYRSGWSVVEFLTHRFRYHPAERWTARVLDGRVAVNGLVVPPDHPVDRDDVVTYSFYHSEPEVDTGYEILHEDESLLAVAKSGNLPVHAGGVYISNTLITLLRKRFGSRVSLAHRLDRETSGVVLLTRDRAAARELSQQFREGRVVKDYLAVVHGWVGPDSFTVDAPIGQGPAALTPKRCVDFDHGKPARTVFRVESRGGDLTVLEARPETGRTNQIRVHLAHIGHPLVGDKSYGDRDRDTRYADITRHALHCRSLAFEHPVTGHPLRIEAGVPGDLKRLQERVEGQSA